jgi:SH3-like domain-containing protein
MDGQGDVRREQAGSRRRIGAIAALAVLCAALAGAAAAAAAAERQTPSGLPVPRYISLKFGKVNARAGPGDDHRLLFVYRVKGLPVQVVAETTEWRRICDPEGHLVWVHRRTTQGRRTLMNTKSKPAPLYRRPRQGARVVAYLNPRALAALDRCQKDWCRVRVDGVSGWTPRDALWGASPAVQCR